MGRRWRIERSSSRRAVVVAERGTDLGGCDWRWGVPSGRSEDARRIEVGAMDGSRDNS